MSDGMEDVTENETEVPGTRDRARGLNHKLRVFLTISVVLICFKSSQQLESICIKQYLYHWCRQYLNKTANPVIVKNETVNETESCEHKAKHGIEEEAQKLASQWEMYSQIISGVLAFLSTNVLGTLSDYIGRKTVGCLSLFSVALRISLFAVFIHFDLHFVYFLIGYVVTGVLGSVVTFSVIALSSVASVTSGTNDRIVAFAVINTIITIGLLTTDITSGYFISSDGFFYPILTSACGVFLSLILTVLLLPETMPERSVLLSEYTNTEPTVSESEHPTCLTLFKNYFGLYFGRQTENKTILRICIFAFILLEFAILGERGTLTLYQLESPFCWTSVELGWYEAVRKGVCNIVGNVVLKLLLYVLASDVIACIAIASLIVFKILTALARTSVELFIALGVGLLMDTPFPIIKGWMSKRTPPNRQGALFASLESAQLLSKSIAAPVSLTIYSHTLDDMKGAVFLVLAGVGLAALLLMIWLSVVLRRETRRREMSILNGTPDEDLLT